MLLCHLVPLENLRKTKENQRKKREKRERRVKSLPPFLIMPPDEYERVALAEKYYIQIEKEIEEKRILNADKYQGNQDDMQEEFELV